MDDIDALANAKRAKPLCMAGCEALDPLLTSTDGFYRDIMAGSHSTIPYAETFADVVHQFYQK
ncbi:MAG TPA: hypothetical protein VNP04_21620 [Alphaproteobacteria bacterium]|nr:hypothetical protein [Alphaproteobacteria bacterium]